MVPLFGKQVRCGRPTVWTFSTPARGRYRRLLLFFYESYVIGGVTEVGWECHTSTRRLGHKVPAKAATLGPPALTVQTRPMK